MKSKKIFSLLAIAAVCSLLLTTGCGYLFEETAQPEIALKEVPKVEVQRPKPEEQKPEVVVEQVKPKVQPQEEKPKVVVEKVKPKEKPKEQKPTVDLALKFTPQESTTYKIITEARRTVKFEGAFPKEAAFQGGTNQTRIEINFTQQIQTVDDKGNAVAKITIEALKYSSIIKDNPVLDFNSSREKDQNSPLAKLIGQSYTIEISPAGQVTKIIDTKQAQAAVQGVTSSHKAALALLKSDAINERHGTSKLPHADKKQMRPDDNWSILKTFFFGMMGPKSYEKIYTLKEIKDADGRQIAVVEMNAIPSSEMAEQLHKEQAMGDISKMFDNKETYTGELKLDLTAGKVEKHLEKLLSEWVMVDPSAPRDNKEPATLKMIATRFYSLEKID